MDGARALMMSAKELGRLEVLGRVVERRLTQRQAAEESRQSHRSRPDIPPVAKRVLQPPTLRTILLLRMRLSTLR